MPSSKSGKSGKKGSRVTESQPRENPVVVSQLPVTGSKAPVEGQVVEFRMDADDLPLFSKLVTMVGKLTDMRDEKRTKGFLFTQFWGAVKKSISGDTSGERFDKGAIDIIMANKSKNAFDHLIFNVAGVKTEGEIWCGDTTQLAKICSNIDVHGEITVTFSSEKIVFSTPDVNFEMRNDELEALDAVKLAKDMYSHFDTTTDPWKYKEREMPTVVSMDLASLVPVMVDSDLVGQLHYPFAIKKLAGGDGEAFFLRVEAKRPDKITINRDIKDILVDGGECESSYSVGLDSVVSNLGGKAILHLGDWKPMAIESDTEKYHCTVLLANVSKDSEENIWSDEEDIFGDEDDSSEPEKPDEPGEVEEEEEIEETEDEETVVEEEEFF